jgi:hypothetical protein
MKNPFSVRTCRHKKAILYMSKVLQLVMHLPLFVTLLESIFIPSPNLCLIPLSISVHSTHVLLIPYFFIYHTVLEFLSVKSMTPRCALLYGAVALQRN